MRRIRDLYAAQASCRCRRRKRAGVVAGAKHRLSVNIYKIFVKYVPIPRNLKINWQTRDALHEVQQPTPASERGRERGGGTTLESGQHLKANPFTFIDSCATHALHIHTHRLPKYCDPPAGSVHFSDYWTGASAQSIKTSCCCCPENMSPAGEKHSN